MQAAQAAVGVYGYEFISGVVVVGRHLAVDSLLVLSRNAMASVTTF